MPSEDTDRNEYCYSSVPYFWNPSFKNGAFNLKSISSNKKTFNLIKGESLLDGLERTGHQVEYQCRSGYCGMCKVKKLEGTVEYLEEPLAFVAPDEILPCVCLPSSDLRLDVSMSELAA